MARKQSVVVFESSLFDARVAKAENPPFPSGFAPFSYEKALEEIFSHISFPAADRVKEALFLFSLGIIPLPSFGEQAAGKFSPSLPFSPPSLIRSAERSRSSEKQPFFFLTASPSSSSAMTNYGAAGLFFPDPPFHQ